MEDYIRRLQLQRSTNSSPPHFLNPFMQSFTGRKDIDIKLLISEDPALQADFDKRHVSILHIIARRGTIEMAAGMLMLRSDFNYLNFYGETPIFYAIKHSAEMVKFLIHCGASVNVKCKRQVSPLHESLLAGSEETVQAILNAILADKQKHANVLNPKYLRDLITVDNSEETVRSLLNHKVDLCIKAKDYPLLIFFAAKTGNMDLLKLTLEDCRKYLDLSERERQRFQLKIVNPPKELNFPGYFDRTALHYATKQQLPKTVLFLLEAGADVNCRTNEGYTPLHYAMILGNYEICEILFRFGASVNASFCLSPPYFVDEDCKLRALLNSGEGYYYDEHLIPMMRSVKELSLEPKTFDLKIMKLLLQNKADPEFSRREGKTPLLEACEAGCLEAVKLLLEFGANIQACDVNMNSALHYSVNWDPISPLFHSRESNLELIEYVVDHGVNVNKINFRGYTALHCVFRSYKRGDPNIVESLLELGADFKLRIAPKSNLSIPERLNFNIGVEICQRYLLAFIALKEDTLGDYIQDYIPDEDEMITKTQEYFIKCKLELERLKRTKIVEDVSCTFYDFLTWDIYKMPQIIGNDEVKLIFKLRKLRYDFPCYACLLDSRFRRLKKLEKTIVEMVDVVENCLKNLPTLVVEKVLSFLGPKDFRNFGRLMSKKL